LGVLLVALTAYRLTLIGRGHFYWSDERCYLPAISLVEAVGRGERREAIAQLFEAPGRVPPARPVFVLVSVVPVLLQKAVGRLFGVNPDVPAYFHAASVFNVLVSLGITGCVYVLGRRWTDSWPYGSLAALLYSLTAGANVWIRHLVPYQESLLFFLGAIGLITKCPARAPGNRGAAWVIAGLLAALSYACYPGHYAAVWITGAVVLRTGKRRWIALPVYALAATTVLAILEGLSRLVDRSYLSDLTNLAGSVTMGDPKEGFVFAWRYLRHAEGLLGLGLAAGCVAFLIQSALRHRPSAINNPCSMPAGHQNRQLAQSTARWALAAALVWYLVHASLGVFFGSMIFYGRLLMPVMPLLVLAAVAFVARLPWATVRRLAVLGLLAAAAVSFTRFAVGYHSVVYPAEFLQDTMTKLGRDIVYPANALWAEVDEDDGRPIEALDPELTVVADTRPEGSNEYVTLAPHAAAALRGTKFIGVNLKYLWYVAEEDRRFEPPPGYALAAQAVHPESFAAHLFEGRRPWERRRIVERGYTMRLYERSE
jgi:hypothetical protein